MMDDIQIWLGLGIMAMVIIIMFKLLEDKK